MIDFELVLPCYNESANLKQIVTRAVDAAKSAGHGPSDFQLVLINNGSTDDSARVFAELGRSELAPWFRTVLVEVNQGYGFGLWSGLKTTTARYVGWSHADQQCDPKDAFAALDLLKKDRPESTVVKGIRFGRNAKDKFVSRVFELFARLFLGIHVHEINAQPKVFARGLLAKVSNPPKTFAFDLYVLYQAEKAGYVTKTIPVEFPPRIHGTSKWAFSFMSRYKTILGMIRYMWQLSLREGRL